MRLNHLTDNELQSSRDSQEVSLSARSHLATCSDCRQQVDTYEKLFDLLAQPPSKEMPGNLVNAIMAKLPRPKGRETWRVALRWTTKLIAAVLFIGILAYPFDFNTPSISMPSLEWPSMAIPPVLEQTLVATRAALAPEQLPLYLFMFLTGLVLYNLDRIFFGVRRQRI